MNFDQELDDLNKRNQKLQEEYSQTLFKIDMHKNQYQEALSTLKDFGCDSVEEAEAMIAALEKEIEQGIEEILEDLE